MKRICYVIQDYHTGYYLALDIDDNLSFTPSIYNAVTFHKAVYARDFMSDNHLVGYKVVVWEERIHDYNR